MQIGPVKGKNFYISTWLNDGNTGIGYTKDFFCEQECWYRLKLPKESLKEGENLLKACLNNSIDTTKSILQSESTVGVYKTADFSGNAFQEKAEKYEALIGEKLEITLLLHNKGSSAVEVEMRHARELAEDKYAYVVVDGNAYFNGLVEAGQVLEVKYSIKPRVVGSISLPPAVVYYKNEFGEEQQIFAKAKTIVVGEPERKVNAFVVKEREINNVGEQTGLRLAVKNEGRTAVYNIEISMLLPEGLHFIQEPERSIGLLKPEETRFFDFSVNARPTGEYKIGCKVNYIDFNASETKCGQSTLVFEGQEVPQELIVGIVLVAFAVAAYLYIQKGK
jgi:uncharacterized repeat protein (TIGR01451 family)